LSPTDSRIGIRSLSSCQSVLFSWDCRHWA
jgi:hypothetical protein